MFVSLAVMGLLILLFFKREKKEEEALKAAGKARKVPVRIGSTGLKMHALLEAGIRRLKSKGPAAEKPKLMKSAAERKIETANLYGAIYLLSMLGAVLGLVTGIMARQDRTVTEIERPGFGEEKTVELIAGMDGTEAALEILVAGREPSEAEMMEIFDVAFQESAASWLGENESFEAVRKNLAFSAEDGRGIHYRFQSEAPEKLTNLGTILEEEIPGEGETVAVAVTLSYGLYEKTYDLEVRLLPKAEKEVKTALEEAIEAAELAERGEETLRLPGTAGGSEVTFSKKVLSPYTVLLLVLLIAGLLAYLPVSREKAEIKKREEALAFSYAKAVSGLSAYIGAGLSIRMAWLRMADIYRAETARGERPRDYVYEEMALSANELSNGVPEEDVYVRFGRRCGQHRYLKLGNLLSESIRQGISGLSAALEAETSEALEERKQLALKKGEEAGTKLLAPMMIMLGIVVVVLVIPAFMMF